MAIYLRNRYRERSQKKFYLRVFIVKRTVTALLYDIGQEKSKLENNIIVFSKGFYTFDLYLNQANVLIFNELKILNKTKIKLCHLKKRTAATS